ncbi:hypothetical protein [Microbulbifer magnicolonia]|uniref:hypothetical protein n=1 Tax=Microbulbifer magnicolonia TaxID=3109744 RepID=UPI002B415E14|nr:hypothetical protein [Microbulbifer sp. GG15]
MPVRVDITLIQVLQNKHLFFTLMDRVERDQKNPSMEFTTSDYDKLLMQSVAGLEVVERLKQLDALSLDNLEHCGLLNYRDPQSGRFRLKDFVLEMLRHLDNSRLRELSSAELNQLMAQLEQCYKQVSNPLIPWVVGIPQFDEMLEQVYQTLHGVDSRIRSAVRALKGQAETLAAKVDEQAFNDLEHTDQVREALDSILKIHERYVTPTLQFLDERLDIRRLDTELDGSYAPMALVRKIVERFQQHNQTEHVARLNRIQLHILGNSQDVGEIANSLETYIKYAQDERRRYNRTEELFNVLKDAVQERQTGQLRNWALRADDPVFNPVRILGGLKSYNRSYNAKLNWPESRGLAEFNELLRVRLKNETLHPKAGRKPVQEPPSAAEIAKRNAVSRIMEAMEGFGFDADYQDAYRVLHEYLCATMPGYRLNLLLDALPFLGAKGQLQTHQPAEFSEIDHKDMRLRYRKRVYLAKREEQARENQ